MTIYIYIYIYTYSFRRVRALIDIDKLSYMQCNNSKMLAKCIFYSHIAIIVLKGSFYSFT